MRKIFLFMVIVLVISSCSLIRDNANQDLQREYGTLVSAVLFSPSVVIGEYGNNIPNDFNADKFMKLVHHKIPPDYYNALMRYALKIEPKRTYYLIEVFDPKSKSLIMFDYSCSPELDGPVFKYPEKYDVNNLSIYDKCSTK